MSFESKLQRGSYGPQEKFLFPNSTCAFIHNYICNLPTSLHRRSFILPLPYYPLTTGYFPTTYSFPFFLPTTNHPLAPSSEPHPFHPVRKLIYCSSECRAGSQNSYQARTMTPPNSGLRPSLTSNQGIRISFDPSQRGSPRGGHCGWATLNPAPLANLEGRKKRGPLPWLNR